MLHDEDLEAAIGAGIVTQAQADALRTFASERRTLGAAERADEERFRFMRGFNDFFFAIGVALLAAGLAFLSASVAAQAGRIAYAIGAVGMWILAEFLVRCMRLVLPGILLAALFAAFVVACIPVELLPGGDLSGPIRVGRAPGSMWSALFGIPGLPGLAVQGAVKAAAASLAAIAFYARFRFPFALLLIAGGGVIALQLALVHFAFNDSNIARQLILLVCGIAVFAAAMWFDLSDRLRLTRRSDCAFWLHIVAAPLLVHSLVSLVTADVGRLDAFGAAMIGVIAVALTLVALIVDRRALLVSALAYVAAALSFALSRAATGGVLLIIVPLLLGAMVLALGTGWSALRRRLIPLLSPGVTERLPPVATA